MHQTSLEKKTSALLMCFSIALVSAGVKDLRDRTADPSTRKEVNDAHLPIKRKRGASLTFVQDSAECPPHSEAK